jgi:hypothetical protein
MVSKIEVMELVNQRVRRILLVAEAALSASQFQAFRTVVLNEFGRNGLVGELDRLDGQGEAVERDGWGRNR